VSRPSVWRWQRRFADSQSSSFDGLTMKLSPPIRFKDRYAQVSDLRWAFLVCTAYFGYSFARSSALNDVRKQILNPDEIIVPQWYVDAPKMENSKVYLCENEGVVAVKYRGQSVVLP
jgi:hypothetical protein